MFRKKFRKRKLEQQSNHTYSYLVLLRLNRFLPTELSYFNGTICYICSKSLLKYRRKLWAWRWSTWLKSWCSYQRDITTKQLLHKLGKWPFPDAVLAVINLASQQLASVEFLEGWKGYSTQNPNEALNHVIWSLAS